jgi:hypothetical protein
LSFGDWMPDMPDLENPGAIEAHNVFPAAGGGYSPFPKLLSDADPLPSTVIGALLTFDANSKEAFYAGVKDGIWMRNLSSPNFTNLLTLGTAVDESIYWNFTPFGDNIVAIHYSTFPYVDTIGGAGPFALLGGNPPRAACGSRVGDFLVLGNLAEDPDDTTTTGPFPRRIRWSGFNNIEDPWVSDPATQADFNDMPAEGGAVVGITGREFGTIFQERMISRMTYTGPPTIFEIDTVEDARGAISGGTMIDMGSGVFFIANDGFFLWNGTTSTPIGDSRVDRWFFNRLNYSQRQRIVGAVDYQRGCVLWAFPTGAGTQLTDVIIFSYRMNRWAHATLPMDYLVSGAAPGASLDDFIGVPLDSTAYFPGSLDDLFYASTKPSLSIFDTAHTFGVLRGGNLPVTLDTAEASGPDGSRWFINAARPIVDMPGPYAYVQLIRREQLMGEAPIFDPPVKQELNGECPVLGDARYIRVRVTIPENTPWGTARGVTLMRKQTGRN